MEQHFQDERRHVLTSESEENQDAVDLLLEKQPE